MAHAVRTLLIAGSLAALSCSNGGGDATACGADAAAPAPPPADAALPDGGTCSTLMPASSPSVITGGRPCERWTGTIRITNAGATCEFADHDGSSHVAAAMTNGESLILRRTFVMDIDAHSQAFVVTKYTRQ